MFIIMSSNKLQYLRQNYRSQLRKDQIKKYQDQIRKSLIRYWKDTIKECSFCFNKDLSQQNSQGISYQLIGIFNKSYICGGHIQLLFSKIMETVQSQPSNVEHLIYKDSEEQTQLYIRKVFLLLQIISNEILIKNQQIQTKIYNTFKNSNSFGQILFDSAFGLNNCSFYQSEQTKINLNADAKRISFNTLLFIFYKYPLLLVHYFEDYPIVWFLRECNQNKLLEIYEVLSDIFESTRTDPAYQKIYLHAESCLREHVQESKTLKSSCEVQQKLFWLINNFLKINPLPNYELMFEILQLCKNKKPRLIKKINSRLIVLAQQKQQLDEYHQQLLTNTLSMIQQFYNNNCDNQMEIE